MPDQALKTTNPSDNVEDSVQYEEQQLINWQLAITTGFFDRCCPNQPGFSTSVAAITILPGARKLSQAWSRWYNAAAALRRLRCIRSAIADRLSEKYLNEAERQEQQEEHEAGHVCHHHGKLQRAHGSTRNIFKDKDACTGHLVTHISSLSSEERMSQLHDLSDDISYHLFELLEYGPEQAAAYGREYAMAASGCVPNGWGNVTMNFKSIQELLLMEKDALEDVKEATESLRRIKTKMTSGASETANNDSDVKISIENNNIEMKEVDDLQKRNYFMDVSTKGDVEIETGSPEKGTSLTFRKKSNVSVKFNCKDDETKTEFPIKGSKTHSRFSSRKRSQIDSSIIEESLKGSFLTKRRTNSQFKKVLEKVSILRSDDSGKLRKSLEDEEKPKSSVQVDGNMNLIEKVTWKSFKEWAVPSFKTIFHDRLVRSWKNFYRESTFAVVTFTNRQGKMIFSVEYLTWKSHLLIPF